MSQNQASTSYTCSTEYYLPCRNYYDPGYGFIGYVLEHPCFDFERRTRIDSLYRYDGTTVANWLRDYKLKQVQKQLEKTEIASS